MNLLNALTQNIKQRNLFQKEDRLLIAVSGGVDSVVLCELCRQAGYAFTILHCNFQLRGEESERDESFVRSLGKKYGVEVLVKKFDTEQYAAGHKQSIQEVARALRYDWFSDLCSVESDRKTLTLTAHHANDSAETMLMNIFKGTGIRGLQGIKAKHPLLPHIVRPLLFVKKTDLVEFASQNKLTFVEDSSNLTDKYTRNYFRHQLMPLLQTVYPTVEDNLVNNLQRFEEMEMLYQQSIDLHKSKLLERKGNEVHIPVLKLLKAVPLTTIVYEIIREFNFSSHQTDDVMSLLNAATGKYVDSSSHRIFRNRHWLVMAPLETELARHIVIDQSDKHIEFANGRLTIITTDIDRHALQSSNLIAQLDADKIQFPLLLRQWKTGDYFYPLGMPKKKKLNRFLIDQKLSMTQKEKVWVIESNQKILWVIGMRIDDRFKVTPSTRKVLSINLKTAGEPA